MKEHQLRTWPVLFQPIITGQKTFEYRLDDRHFSVGDTLWLREYDINKKEIKS